MALSYQTKARNPINTVAATNVKAWCRGEGLLFSVLDLSLELICALNIQSDSEKSVFKLVLPIKRPFIAYSRYNVNKRGGGGGAALKHVALECCFGCFIFILFLHLQTKTDY